MLAVELHDETAALRAALFAPPESTRERGVGTAQTIKQSLPV